MATYICSIYFEVEANDIDEARRICFKERLKINTAFASEVEERKSIKETFKTNV